MIQWLVRWLKARRVIGKNRWCVSVATIESSENIALQCLCLQCVIAPHVRVKGLCPPPTLLRATALLQSGYSIPLCNLCIRSSSWVPCWVYLLPITNSRRRRNMYVRNLLLTASNIPHERKGTGFNLKKGMTRTRWMWHRIAYYKHLITSVADRHICSHWYGGGTCYKVYRWGWDINRQGRESYLNTIKFFLVRI